MKFVEAYKDSAGFHYVVELAGPDGQKKQRPFNYGPAPGFVYVATAVSLEEDSVVPKSIPVTESEDDYQKRIEVEIEDISNKLEKAWLADPTTGGLTTNIRTDLLKKSKKSNV